MNVLNEFDERKNFWQVNPQLKLLGPFKDLYKKDRSRGKKNSSRVMWAIAFRLDPSEQNKFRNLPDDQKEELIGKDFIKDNSFKWDDYSDHMDFYKNIVLSQAEKSLLSWNETMSLRDKELKSFYKEALKTRDIGMIAELDKILASTSKFYTDYQKIKKDFDEDQDNRGAEIKLNH